MVTRCCLASLKRPVMKESFQSEISLITRSSTPEENTLRRSATVLITEHGLDFLEWAGMSTLITLILKSTVARQDIEVRGEKTKTLVSLEKFQFSRGSDGDK